MGLVLVAQGQPHQAVGQYRPVGAAIGVDTFLSDVFGYFGHGHEGPAAPGQVQLDHWPVGTVELQQRLVAGAMFVQQQGFQVAEKEAWTGARNMAEAAEFAQAKRSGCHERNRQKRTHDF